MLTIHLFGEFECFLHGQPVTALYAPRLRALLAYLLLHRNAPVSRQQLAAHFWPESGDAQSRTNLRNLLNQFRAALPNAEAYISSDLQTVQWRLDAHFQADVAEFQQALFTARQSNDLVLARHLFEKAIQLYRADLLSGCYDDWLLPLREQLKNSQQQALEALCDLLEQQRDLHAALDIAQRLLLADPLREYGYARLMKLHASLGDRASALRVYHTCAATLVRELGVEPSAATRVIYERLLNLEGDELTARSLPIANTLVGRGQAWAQLQQLWLHASRGQPHLALISGEAGVGKTRLAEELLEWAHRQGIITLSAHCYSAAGRLALAPVLDWLRSDVFRPAIDTLDPSRLADLARLMPEVASQPITPTLPLLSSDSWQRHRLFEVLARLVLWKAQPILLFVDDLQWCDSETLDWLHYLLRFDPRSPLLLVATVRSEEFAANQLLNQLLHQLRRTDHLSELPLDRLDLAETMRLVLQLTGNQLASDQAESFFAQTEGNPLFIVETIRAQVNELGNTKYEIQDTKYESPASDLPSPLSVPRSPLPPKVHAVIQGRLLRLSASARALVDVAAMIGRSFTLPVLAHASEQSEEALTLGMDELWQNKIVHTQDVDAYDFTHDKLREVALAAISPTWRRLLHQRVASALSSVYAHNLDGVNGQLAHHYEQSGQFAQAIVSYQRAATVAHRLSALEDAIGYLRHALQLLHHMNDDATRLKSELGLQVALAPLLQARRGYSAPEVEQTLRRALDLCRDSGSAAQMFRILWGMGRFYLVLPNLRAGLETGDEMLKLASAHNDPDLLMEAHNVLGALHFHIGNLTEACSHFEAALRIYDPTRHQQHRLDYGQDPGIVSAVRHAWALWHRGLAEEAHQRARDALELNSVCDHPFSNAFGFSYIAGFFLFTGDVESAQRYALAGKEVADTYGFPIFQGMTEQLYGATLVEQGKTEEGMKHLLHGWQTFTATGSELGLGYFALLRSQGHAHLGQIDEALAILEKGFAISAKTGEGWSLAMMARARETLQSFSQAALKRS